ncbi:MAG: dienelactone hydrolase family protein [Candidatus Eiseniibacteriota bacterium]
MARPGRSALCLIAALAMTGAAPAQAASRLEAPWPDPESLEGVAGQPVTFQSSSPFTLTDVGPDQERDPPTTAEGTLFLPAKAASTARVPAVVLIHGAAGVQDARDLTYGRQLASLGIAALSVDAFAARRDRASSFVERLIEITEAMLLADVYGGLHYLAARPDIDARHIALVGFSYGGMVTLYAAQAMVAERYAPDGLRFAGHAAFYAPCIARFDDKRATGAPVLMLMGGKDQIVDKKRCAEVAGDLRAGGAEVDSVVYPEAMHQWDGAWPGPRRLGRNLADCKFVVRRSGLVQDTFTFMPMLGPTTRKLILAACADSEGYLLGRDDAVRAKSNRDLGRFLARVLAR